MVTGCAGDILQEVLEAFRDRLVSPEIKVVLRVDACQFTVRSAVTDASEGRNRSLGGDDLEH